MNTSHTQTTNISKILSNSTVKNYFFFINSTVKKWLFTEEINRNKNTILGFGIENWDWGLAQSPIPVHI
jgi:hypothetical protein